MGYDCSRRSEIIGDDRLSPEEFEVRESIAEAGYTFDEMDLESFVPTDVLYRVYRNWITARQQFRLQQDEPPDDLNPRQFGAALNWVFDLEDRKVRRRWHGKKKWGYLGFTGPEARPTRDCPGRPRVRLTEEEANA